MLCIVNLSGMGWGLKELGPSGTTLVTFFFFFFYLAEEYPSSTIKGASIMWGMGQEKEAGVSCFFQYILVILLTSFILTSY